MSCHVEGGQLSILGGNDEPQSRLHRRSQIPMLRLSGKLQPKRMLKLRWMAEVTLEIAHQLSFKDTVQIGRFKWSQ